VSSLEVSDLVKGYGAKPVLRGLDLTVASGTITAILGASGSGKTTLLRVLCGFDRSERGSIVIDGEVVDDPGHYLPPERRRIGYVPQDGNLFPHLSIAANIRFGLPRAVESRQRVADLLDLIGLADRARSYPHQLSGGQQQRVALARALAVHPRLVLLDEPFASLDAALRASVRADVVGILRQAEATALLVTHDQDEALSLSDTVAVLRDGVIAQLDTPHQLYARPIDPDLAGFVGEMNLIAGTVDGDFVTTALGRHRLEGSVAAVPAGSVLVMVRPEQLVLRPAEGEPADGGCTVVRQEFYGHDAIVRVALPRGDAPTLVVRVRGDHSWPAGTQAVASVDGPVVVYADLSGRPRSALGRAT
jgi:iron(III) transport system ATP-binding protein